VNVEHAHRSFDIEFHQVNEGCPAGDEADVRALLRTPGVGGGLDRCSHVLWSRKFKCSHGRPRLRQKCLRTSWIAAMIFWYAPQRQMLPLMNSFTSASVGPHGSSSNATADIIWPDVQ